MRYKHKIRKREPAAGFVAQKTARAAEKAVKALDLPADLAAGMTHLEFSGNREVVVEGCRGILEYDEDVVCMDLGKLKVRFLGRGLSLRNFTDHSAILNGFVTSVEFIS